MRTLVVTPTYQEAGNIEGLIRRTRAALPHADLLVVDDGSPDGTAGIAERVGAELGQVEVLHRSGKSGLGSAYRAGFAIGLDRGYEILCEIDADLSHDPSDLARLVGPVASGDADLVIGSRYVPGGAVPEWPWWRRALSRSGNAYAGLVLGWPVRDITAGFRAFRASTLTAIDVVSTRSQGYGFQIETTHRVLLAGGRVLEVPITFADRVDGTSKLSLRVAFEELGLVTWWGLRDRPRRRRTARTAPAPDRD